MMRTIPVTQEEKTSFIVKEIADTYDKYFAPHGIKPVEVKVDKTVEEDGYTYFLLKVDGIYVMARVSVHGYAWGAFGTWGDGYLPRIHFDRMVESGRINDVLYDFHRF